MDESGDDGDYRDSHGSIIRGSSRYLVVGGILIENSKIKYFDQRLNELLDEFFIRKGISLPDSFKLHCADLKKRKKHPYNQLTRTEEQKLTKNVFDIINTLDCLLIAASLDIEKHCDNYTDRINPKAYMLFYCFEKLEELKKHGGFTSRIFYEEFNHIRKKIKEDIEKLLDFPTFPNPHNLKDIEKQVSSGKQNQHSGLQIADFIANATWFNRTQPNHKNNHFDIIRQKFFCEFNGRIFYCYKEI